VLNGVEHEVYHFAGTSQAITGQEHQSENEIIVQRLFVSIKPLHSSLDATEPLAARMKAR
jgi:hypothetical protein